jgi:phage protein D
LEVRPTGADSLSTRRPRAWEGQTIGIIVREIASANGLTAKVPGALSIVSVPRFDQTNESDISALTRLAKQHDAVATVKGGFLIFARRGSGETVSGLAMTAVTLRPEDVTDWRVSLSDSERYDSVEARYYDRDAAEESWVRAGSGEGESVYRLRKTYVDQSSAQAAADAKLAALSRGSALLSLSLPGRTVFAAETPIILEAFGAGVDGRWITTSVEHRLSREGYQVTIDAEQGLTDE